VTKEQRLAVLAEARIHGMGGYCGEAAIAINKILFDGKGELVAALNGPLYYDKGIIVGHVGVLFDGDIWDAEGTFEGEDGVEEFRSWGMVDPEDPDYRLSPEDAADAEVLAMSAQEIRLALDVCPAEDYEAKLLAARRDVLRRRRRQAKEIDDQNDDEDERENTAKLDYERGDCAILALRLAELTGLPLVGMFEGEDLHHVAVEVDRERVLDVRGVSTKRERAMDAGRPEARWRRVDLRTIHAYGLPGWDDYDEDELDAVDSAADDALAQME
jgi:hypothetical protein